MKYIHITTALLAALFLMTLTSCSSDIEENESILNEESETYEIIEPEPEPDWADSVITITVGRFKTKRQILSNLKRTFLFHPWTEHNMMNERWSLTPEDQQYTVEIAVFTVKELGINRMTNIEEVTNRFKEIGYRPLTTEEAIEVRLHLPDQPDSSTRHKMSSFFVLSPEETPVINGEPARWCYTIPAVAYLHEGDRKELEKATGQKGGVLRALHETNFDWARGKFTFSPDDPDFHGILSVIGFRFAGRRQGLGGDYEIDYGGSKVGYPGVRFAAAKIGSEKDQ